jgi:hypothetical protein
MVSITDLKYPPEGFHIWMNKDTTVKSETACVKHIKSGLSKCTTRIIELVTTPFSNDSTDDDDRPNILLILIDPISRPHFHRTMPRTELTLEELDFLSFSKYSAVGPNSGPNQAALYSGIPLEKRNGIGRDIHGEQWLWDRLRSAGYVTLKGEDGCIENSNMIQSLKPNTTHGNALEGLFCFDAFSRPNCIGTDSASSLLFKYGEQFSSTYERKRRWASFLHFTDTHEDTMILAATIDETLSTFLKKMETDGHFEKSVVILCSDHGLHYGPIFQTARGRIEATEPILHVRIPDYLKDTIDMPVFKRNAALYTTAYDLHETLLELTKTATYRVDSIRKGISLTQLLPETRKECKTTDLIPTKYCDLEIAGANSMEKFNRHVPKVDNFFLDIPKNRRSMLQMDSDCSSVDQLQTTMKKFEACQN